MGIKTEERVKTSSIFSPLKTFFMIILSASVLEYVAYGPCLMFLENRQESKWFNIRKKLDDERKRFSTNDK